MYLLTENINFYDLLDLFGVKQKDFEQIEESFYDYPTDIFYEFIFGHIKIHEKKFSPITFCDNYDVEEFARDLFMESAKCKTDIKEKYISTILDFLADEVLSCFDEDIEFKFSLCGEEVTVEVSAVNIDHFIKLGMSAWGEFDWDSEDKESLRTPYFILRECLHYCEACNTKPKIKCDYDWDRIWNFGEDGESIFDEILKKWKEGSLYGQMVVKEKVSLDPYTIAEVRNLFLIDIPEEYNDCKVYLKENKYV